MIETADLIGKPFAYHGRGPDAYDCWGLVKVCYQRWHGVELPDYPSTRSPRLNGVAMGDAARRDWAPVEGPLPGSVVMMRVRSYGAHVGFLTSPTRMIHTLQGMNVVSARLSTFQNQIMGYYRYVE